MCSVYLNQDIFSLSMTDMQVLQVHYVLCYL